MRSSSDKCPCCGAYPDEARRECAWAEVGRLRVEVARLDRQEDELCDEAYRLREIAGDAFRSLQAGRLNEASEYLRGIRVRRG